MALDSGKNEKRQDGKVAFEVNRDTIGRSLRLEGFAFFPCYGPLFLVLPCVTPVLSLNLWMRGSSSVNKPETVAAGNSSTGGAEQGS